MFLLAAIIPIIPFGCKVRFFLLCVEFLPNNYSMLYDGMKVSKVNTF
jgi:hypothetical protein